MKIKKKELRKREAQLPINYPDPDVLPESLPGGAIDLATELVQVELLCKRLAHNEVVVRDAVLAEVPSYLRRLTEPMVQMEAEYAEEMACVQTYLTEHPNAASQYHYDNLPLALHQYHEKTAKEGRQELRREALKELRHRRAMEQKEREMVGRYPAGAVDFEAGGADADVESVEHRDAAAPGTVNERRARYKAWIRAWSDLELVFLKLSRGIHFCLWHSDKPLVQLDCAQRIALLLDAPLTNRSKILFYGALFRVLAREWPTIDHYRLDKYLALVRKMVYQWVMLVHQLAEADTAETAESLSTTSPAKKRSSTKKRVRSSSSAEDGADGGATSMELLTATAIPERYVRQIYGNCPRVRVALHEILYICHTHLFSSTTSIGLTMHICDVAFDELSRSYLPTPLYVCLAAGIPLYAMSLGNYVEKRVLDSFFPPLAGGVLVARRAEQLVARRLRDGDVGGRRKLGGKAAAVLRRDAALTEAQAEAAEDNKTILLSLAECCRQFAVARGTVRAVRVMFNEAELVMRQSAEPAAFQTLTRTAQRRRIEKEVNELNETRKLVKRERASIREIKKTEKRQLIRDKISARKAAIREAQGDAAADAVDDKELRRELLVKRKATRNTKRKKDYQLTKADLFGDANDEVHSD